MKITLDEMREEEEMMAALKKASSIPSVLRIVHCWGGSSKGTDAWRDAHPSAKTKSGILISFGRGLGFHTMMETVSFVRGSGSVILGYGPHPYGWGMIIQSVDCRLSDPTVSLLPEIIGVLKDPSILQHLAPIDVAGIIDCPKNEPMHYHHDGCPACDDDDDDACGGGEE